MLINYICILTLANVLYTINEEGIDNKKIRVNVVSIFNLIQNISNKYPKITIININNKAYNLSLKFLGKLSKLASIFFKNII